MWLYNLHPQLTKLSSTNNSSPLTVFEHMDTSISSHYNQTVSSLSTLHLADLAIFKSKWVRPKTLWKVFVGHYSSEFAVNVEVFSAELKIQITTIFALHFFVWQTISQSYVTMMAHFITLHSQQVSSEHYTTVWSPKARPDNIPHQTFVSSLYLILNMVLGYFLTSHPSTW